MLLKFLAIKFLHAVWLVISFIPSILFNIIYHPIARKLSRRHLPEAANRIGLVHSESKLRSGFGQLTGVINNHNIVVKPDENAKVITFLKNETPLLLWTEKSIDRPNGKIIEFKTNDWIFNSIFKTQRASKNFAQKLKDSPDLINSFNHFYLDWIWSISSIYVSDQAIYCDFNYGHPFFSYIPASSVEKIVNDMVRLADQIDSAK